MPIRGNRPGPAGRGSRPAAFVGLDHYRQLADDPIFWQALSNNLWYALGTIPGRPTRVVIRETDKENTVTLGLAMFAQVHHDRLPWVAPLSFGVGIRGDGRATFYLGPAVRFGQRASFTAGVAVGPIAALPAGVHERESVTDTNFLSDLSSRNAKAWYAAVTYTFASLR